MLAAGVLLATLLLVSFGPWLLRSFNGQEVRPLAGIAICLLLSWATVGGVLIAAALVALPSLPTIAQFPLSVEACLRDVPGAALNHNGIVQLAVSAVVSVLFARLAFGGYRTSLANYRRRCRHRALVRLAARHIDALGIDVVEHDDPLVYCIPGRGGRIVFTSAAVSRLSRHQRAAVVAHEQAHLQGHHHLLVGAAASLCRAFPGIPLFRAARDATTRLVEMRADDLAARRHGRRFLAEALVALSDHAGPAGTLAAGGVTATARVRRLAVMGDDQHLSLRTVSQGLSVAAVGGVILAAPVLFSLAGHLLFCLV